MTDALDKDVSRKSIRELTAAYFDLTNGLQQKEFRKHFSGTRSDDFYKGMLSGMMTMCSMYSNDLPNLSHAFIGALAAFIEEKEII